MVVSLFVGWLCCGHGGGNKEVGVIKVVVKEVVVCFAGGVCSVVLALYHVLLCRSGIWLCNVDRALHGILWWECAG